MRVGPVNSRYIYALPPLPWVLFVKLRRDAQRRRDLAQVLTGSYVLKRRASNIQRTPIRAGLPIFASFRPEHRTRIRYRNIRAGHLVLSANVLEPSATPSWLARNQRVRGQESPLVVKAEYLRCARCS